MTDEKQLLRIRAKELAIKEESSTSDDSTGREMLEFILADEHYAIETSYVAEALNIQDLTPIPGTPAYLEGLMNVRGRIIPVVNLKKFFSLREEGIIASTKAVIMKDDAYEVAFLTDHILPTRWLTDKSIRPIPSNLHGIGAEHLHGVTQEAIIIIDGNSLIRKLETSLINKRL